jgi:gliding motility-associated-like protein
VYTLTAFNALGCPASVSAPLQIDPLPQASLVNNTQNLCVPFCADFSLRKITAAPLTSLSWDINAQQFTSPSFSYCFGTAGNTTFRAMIKDTLGCSNTMTFVVNAYGQPRANFDFSPQQPVEGEDVVRFVNSSVSSDQSTWAWHFMNNDGHKSTEENTYYTFENAGVYPVAMVVKNKWGCADTIVKNITVESDHSLFVPSAFTPNADGNNDIFTAKGLGIVKFQLLIFNRWGQKIYETNDIQKGWDGSYKGQDCKEDIYVWKVNAHNIKGKEIIKDGLLTLYR